MSCRQSARLSTVSTHRRPRRTELDWASASTSCRQVNPALEAVTPESKATQTEINGPLSTCTLTRPELAERPNTSEACALTMCGTLGFAPVLSQVAAYGGVTIGAPIANTVDEELQASQWRIVVDDRRKLHLTIHNGAFGRSRERDRRRHLLNVRGDRHRAPAKPPLQVGGSAAIDVCALAMLLLPMSAWRRFKLPLPSGLSTAIQ